MQTISDVEKLSFVRSWLTGPGMSRDTGGVVALGTYLRSHRETIGLLVDDIDKEIAEMIVGKEALVMRCGADAHIPNSVACVCSLVGTVVKISGKAIESGGYHIDGSIKKVSVDEITLPEARNLLAIEKPAGDKDLVGKNVKIVECRAGVHSPSNGACICNLREKIVEIVGVRGSGLYSIKECHRLIARSEFELLLEQPVEPPATKPVETSTDSKFLDNSAVHSFHLGQNLGEHFCSECLKETAQ